jgi:hypothetical protein
MDLIEVVIPKKSFFFILLPNGEMVPIKGYKKIEIDFSERVVFNGGKKQNISFPMITYRVDLGEESQKQIQSLFNMSDDQIIRTLQTRNCRIRVGKAGYVFNAEISAIPSMPRRFINPIPDHLKIFLKLESNKSISLYEEIEYVYKSFNRFEILDIED